MQGQQTDILVASFVRTGTLVETNAEGDMEHELTIEEEKMKEKTTFLADYGQLNVILSRSVIFLYLFEAKKDLFQSCPFSNFNLESEYVRIRKTLARNLIATRRRKKFIFNFYLINEIIKYL